jgi:hypothetical protein
MNVFFRFKPIERLCSGRFRGRRIAGLLASAIVATILAAAPSSATPFVDIRAVWNIVPLEPLPAGVEISCAGDATGGGNAGCSETLALNTSVTPIPGITLIAENFGLGRFTLANTSGGPLTGSLLLGVDYSAFNPGGPEVGLGIDDPVTQAADFGSTLTLASDDLLVFQLFDLLAGLSDSHNCSIGFQIVTGEVLSPTTCGVVSPQFLHTEIFVDLSELAAGSSASITGTKAIGAFFTEMPEPPTIGLMIMALSAMALLGMRFRRPG